MGAQSRPLGRHIGRTRMSTLAKPPPPEHAGEYIHARPPDERLCTPMGLIPKLPEVLAQCVSDGDGLTVMKVLRIHVHAMVAGVAEFNGW